MSNNREERPRLSGLVEEGSQIGEDWLTRQPTVEYFGDKRLCITQYGGYELTEPNIVDYLKKLWGSGKNRAILAPEVLHYDDRNGLPFDIGRLVQEMRSRHSVKRSDQVPILSLVDYGNDSTDLWFVAKMNLISALTGRKVIAIGNPGIDQAKGLNREERRQIWQKSSFGPIAESILDAFNDARNQGLIPEGPIDLIGYSQGARNVLALLGVLAGDKTKADLLMVQDVMLTDPPGMTAQDPPRMLYRFGIAELRRLERIRGLLARYHSGDKRLNQEYPVFSGFVKNLVKRVLLHFPTNLATAVGFTRDSGLGDLWQALDEGVVKGRFTILDIDNSGVSYGGDFLRRVLGRGEKDLWDSIQNDPRYTELLDSLGQEMLKEIAQQYKNSPIAFQILFDQIVNGTSAVDAKVLHGSHGDPIMNVLRYAILVASSLGGKDNATQDA